MTSRPHHPTSPLDVDVENMFDHVTGVGGEDEEAVADNANLPTLALGTILIRVAQRKELEKRNAAIKKQEKELTRQYRAGRALLQKDHGAELLKYKHQDTQMRQMMKTRAQQAAEKAAKIERENRRLDEQMYKDARKARARAAKICNGRKYRY